MTVVRNKSPHVVVTLIAAFALWAGVASAGSPNEDCATAIDMGDTGGTFTGTIDAATFNDFPLPTCALVGFGAEDGPDLAWSINLPGQSLVTLDTIGSTIGDGDTKLMVYEGCMLADVACSDDISGSNFLSSVRFIADPGVTYMVQVEGFLAADEGDVTLTCTVGPVPPASDNDLCGGARTITQLPYEDSVDTFFNTDTIDNTRSVFFGGGASPDAYWTYTPTTTENAVIVAMGFDTAFAIYTGGCGGLTEVLAVDETFGGERAEFTFVAGTTYHLLGEGFSTVDAGLLSLQIGFPSDNNLCPTPRTISSLPYADTVDTTFNESVIDNSESLNFGGGGGPEAFWIFTPAATVTTTVSVLGFDTAAAVFTGPCGGLIEDFAIDQFFGSETFPYTFNAGTTYLIMGEGFTPSQFGDLTLVIGDPPANDDCSTATVTTDSDYPLIGTLLAADRTADIGGNTGGEVWYEFTAAQTGTYSIVADPVLSGINVKMFRFDYQDCAGLGNGVVSDLNGPGGSETTGNIPMNVGDRFSFGIAGALPADQGEFELRLKFVPPTVPVIPFGTEAMAAPPWTFIPGDDFIAGSSQGFANSGTVSILFPTGPGATALFWNTGVWQTNSYPTFNFTPNTLFAARVAFSNSTPQDQVDQTRLRAEPTAFSSVDHVFNINETQNTPMNPASTPTTYLAYFRPFDADVQEQQIVAFDALDNGNAAGVQRRLTLHNLELGSADPNAFLGSANTIVSFPPFTDFDYLNYGTGTFGGLTFYEGGTSGTANGRLQHHDNDGQVGGVGEWTYDQPDGIESTPGALYHAEWDLDTDGAGDTTAPSARFNTRTFNPSISIEEIVRGNAAAFQNAPSPFGTFEQFWVGHKMSTGGGPGNNEDDLVMALAMYNFAFGVVNRDGTLDFYGTRLEELAADDPNLP